MTGTSPDQAPDQARDHALAALEAREAAGRPLHLWLRDDDAVAPGPALDRLEEVVAGVPVTLAVIPARPDAASGLPTGAPLADWVAARPGIAVVQHGWQHRNHAGAGEKKQELGPHRPAGVVLAELAQGRERLLGLYGDRLLPMMVPPWNRIAPAVAEGLAGCGFRALSTFAAERPVPGLTIINTHLDIMDWRGTGGGKPPAVLWAELAALALSPREHAGVLTHHLVHDAAAWAGLDELIAGTRDRAGVRWVPVSSLPTGQGHAPAWTQGGPLRE